MKKVFILLSAAVLIISFAISLTSCGTNEDNTGYDPSLKCERYENCAVFTFDDFSAQEPASFELTRTSIGEGAIYYAINLDKGALAVTYKDTLSHVIQPLVSFSSDNEPANGSGGYVEGGKITVILEAESAVSGEVIIAFDEDALKAVQGDLNRHQHTYRYEVREDAHKKIYTCDCTNLEERDFEQHYDDNTDGRCDECEYDVGIPHEDHSWGYDANETSHKQIFDCGCESQEGYEPHYNNDGDDLCDACGYELSKPSTTPPNVFDDNYDSDGWT